MSVLHFLHKPPVLACVLVAGGLTGYWAPHFSHSLHWILDGYEKLLAMIVLPFIVAAVILSLRQLFHMNRAGRITFHIAMLVLSIVLLFSMIGAGVGQLTGPGRDLPEASLVAFSQMVMANAKGDALEHEVELFAGRDIDPIHAVDTHQILERIIPTNFFNALQMGEVLKIIFFCALLGMSIGVTHRNSRDSFSGTLEAVYAASNKLISWVTQAIPIIAFIAVAGSVSKVGPAAILALFKFILCFSVSALLLSAVFSLVVILLGRLTVREYAYAMIPPLLQAVTTQSAIASAPQTIEAVAQRMKFESGLVELVIPLCATLLRAGPALYFGMATVFVAQMYDVPVTTTAIMLITVGAALAAFSSTGAQGAAIVAFGAIACEFVQLPFEAAIVFFIAIDEIVDAPRTTLNVTAGAACAAIMVTLDRGRRLPVYMDKGVPGWMQGAGLARQ